MARFEKTAFNVDIPVPEIAGALTGALVGKKVTENKLTNDAEEFYNTRSLPGSYYAQTDAIANNLKVLFTPYSVVYIVRNGHKETTIDTIATESMNRDMYVAWQEKNADYFKNLLLNKMNAEIQFAQQQFAKNIIDRHLAVTKKASYDFTPIEIISYAADIIDTFSKPENEKLASVMFEDVLPEKNNFVLELSAGEITKTATDMMSDILGSPLSFLNINDKDKVHKVTQAFMTPGHMKRFGKVAFLPDRVLFVVDNVVVTQLLAFDMDEDAFRAFERKDDKYFMHLFEKEAKMGVRRMRAKLPPEKKNLIKQAAPISVPIDTIFYDNDITPYIYFKALNTKYGDSWLSYSPEVLIKAIEKDFDLIDPIDDIPLNKILACQLVNTSEHPFINAVVFEKMIRSFVGLPIDFTKEEKDNLGCSEFALGITNMDIVTPNDDIYDNFSPEVYLYMVKALADQEVKFFVPSKNYSNSEHFGEFYSELNSSLVNENNRRDIDGVNDLKEQADIIQNNEMINACCLELISSLNLSDIQGKDERALKLTGEAIDNAIKACGIKDDIVDITKRQIYNIAKADEALESNEQMMAGQEAIYNI